MDWRWEMIYIMKKDSTKDDETVDSGHDTVRKFRIAARELNEGSNLEDVSEKFLEIMTLSHRLMSHASTSSSELRTLRKVYTDAAILRGLVQSLAYQTLAAISTLDHSIIVAGPYGTGRLEVILDIIHQLQQEVSSCIENQTSSLKATTYQSPCTVCTVASPEAPPSLFQFQMKYSRHPFILRGYAKDWPALTSRPWRSHAYLSSVAGPGRVVPVEVGNDYRSEDWHQEIMSWDEYLSFLEFADRPSCTSSPHALYLAQHDLLKQFPKLWEDIVIPDYLYADLGSPDFPSYRPPMSNDKMLINAWLGPKGTISPAHIDPYFNFYVQVVGYKRVWLAPPLISHSMYPFPPLEKGNSDGRFLPSSALGNTSRVDVFSDVRNLQNFPAFIEQVMPVSLEALLGPGDVLFFPPGWWHAMKSETTSFSVSMWF